MNTTNDGGPAFPLPDAVYPNGQVQTGSWGMSLRDWFAGQALAGLLAGYYRQDTQKNLCEVPKEAYLVAEAMLASRGAK